MKNALEMNAGGIKCDNPNCNYKDMSVKVEDYINWVNKPCPMCGENLLAEDDYRNTQFLLGMVDLANKIYPKIEDSESTVKTTINMNGTGNMNFAIDSIGNENKQRAKYGKCNGHYKWDLTKSWFNMSNDDFFKLYGFSYHPHNDGNLYEECRNFLSNVNSNKSIEINNMQLKSYDILNNSNILESI